MEINIISADSHLLFCFHSSLKQCTITGFLWELFIYVF
jgi:hypothetical protein